MVAGPQRRRRLGTGDLRIRLISVCAPNKNQLKKQRPGAIWYRGAILGAEKKDSDASVSESFSQYSTEFIRPGIDKTSNSPSRPRPRGWDGRSICCRASICRSCTPASCAAERSMAIELLLRGEVGAGAGGQIPAPGQQLHGPVVDLLVAGDGVWPRFSGIW